MSAKGDEAEMRQMVMQVALKLLAKAWPGDYPAGAIEFEILREPSRR